jgi:hypothetical protein
MLSGPSCVSSYTYITQNIGYTGHISTCMYQTQVCQTSMLPIETDNNKCLGLCLSVVTLFSNRRYVEKQTKKKIRDGKEHHHFRVQAKKNQCRIVTREAGAGAGAEARSGVYRRHQWHQITRRHIVSGHQMQS